MVNYSVKVPPTSVCVNKGNEREMLMIAVIVQLEFHLDEDLDDVSDLD